LFLPRIGIKHEPSCVDRLILPFKDKEKKPFYHLGTMKY
jgi:hypothetical protein